MAGKLKQFIRDWKLPIAIAFGIAGYFLYRSLPTNQTMDRAVNDAIGIIQPGLLIAMLYLTFIKVSPSQLKPCRWHGALLGIQAGSFCALAAVHVVLGLQGNAAVIVEGAMVSLICPTATAAAVIIGKLGGNIAHGISYTVLVNMMVSLLIPVVLPLMFSSGTYSFAEAFWMIFAKVFSLLILPFAAAMVTRHLLPRLHRTLMGRPEAAFHLWLVALTLAIAVSTRSIVHSNVPLWCMLALAAVSLVCCMLQFFLGRRIGRRWSDGITAAQALGQKNTVFAIWLGYTFFDPVTSTVGGFYSVWHNLFNSWQLYRKRNSCSSHRAS